MPYFLHAGSVEVRYENGSLRYLTRDGVEVLRRIYFAIRDHNWLTAKLIIDNEAIEQTDDSFCVRYDWRTDDLGIQMAGYVGIQGDSGGTIAVDFYGKALNSFRKNRIGLCILHPIDGVLGQPAQITEPDGSITVGYFPTFISPHQPFLNIQTLCWQPASGATWQLDFSGDIFEMEDQRNWTDASFKTYSTPLERPFPVAVSAGEMFQQRVVFSPATQGLSDQMSERLSVPKPVVHETALTIGKPFIGVGQRADGTPLTTGEADLLRKLQLSHLRADVFLNLPDWQPRLDNALFDAQRLAIPLALAVFFGENPVAQLHDLHHFLRSHNGDIRSVSLFDSTTLITSDELLLAVVPLLRAEWPGLLIGGGTDDHFAQFNRNPFNYELVDFVTYAIHPQAHASDDLTLQENIAGQMHTVLSAKALSDGKPVHVSPVTLLPRFTTVAATAIERQTVLADSRQITEFGADWTRQSIKALTEAGADSITYYQSHGPAGLVDGDTAYPLYTVFEQRRGNR